MRKCPISLALLLALGPAASAAAQDSELVLFGEPITYTDVPDTNWDFESPDAFDLDLSLTYRRSFTSGTIQREDNPAVPDGRATANVTDIAEYEHLRNVLEIGVDAGVLPGLSLYARLPIVLSDDRSLSSLGSLEARTAATRALEVREPDGATRPLFEQSFRAPTRSGLEYFGLGLAWSVFDQHRTPWVPTWVVQAEGRFSVGEPMHACDAGGNYGDDRATAGVTEDWRCNLSQDPGISDGTNSLRLETRTSYRMRYLEPYAGLSFQIGWPGSSDEIFAPGGDLSGFMNTIPPRVGEMTAGVALIPWEQRARHQRFLIDARLVAAYVSEGHGYSPLFDALGTSGSAYLREANTECPGCAREVAFTGLTDTESHGRVGAQVGLEMQAAKYVKFIAGGSLAWTSPHTLTFTDACNPNVDPSGPSDPREGTCRNGIINPHHRAVVDLPGNRFRIGGQVTFDLHATAVAQF